MNLIETHLSVRLPLNCVWSTVSAPRAEDAAPSALLDDAGWRRLSPHISRVTPPNGRGRPRVANRRAAAGVVWVLHTGAAWRLLPRRFADRKACKRRYESWMRDPELAALLRAQAERLGQQTKARWLAPSAAVPRSS